MDLVRQLGKTTLVQEAVFSAAKQKPAQLSLSSTHSTTEDLEAEEVAVSVSLVCRTVDRLCERVICGPRRRTVGFRGY